MENQTNPTSKFAGVQLFNAVGKRSADNKTEEADVIIAESTVGSFKIMPDVARLLEIQDGSFVAVQTAEIEGKLYVFIGKGKDGVLKVDEEGKAVLDHRQRRQWEVDGFGAVVSETSAGTNVLRFSVASAWKDLGMVEGGSKKVYKLGESMVASLPIGEGNYHTTTLYELVHVRDEAKAGPRRKKKDTAEVGTDTGVNTAGTTGEFTSEEPTQYAQESDDAFNNGFEETEL